MKQIIILSMSVGYVIGLFSGAGTPSLKSPFTIDSSSSKPAPEIYNVSAYCPCELCCGVYADGITANGHVIEQGEKFVAAPSNIPFGTMIDIPGYGKVPVLDRGGAIKGNKLDVYFDTHQKALEWGRQYLKVKVYYE